MTDKPKRSPQRRNTRVTQVLLAVTIAGLLVFVGSIAVTVWFVMGADRADVAEGSYLYARLAGPITDGPVQGGLLDDPADFPPVVTEISASIRAAAEDERISGLYLRLDQPSMGFGSVQEIRSALTVFSDSGKPCVAYSEGYTTGSYYLASACDQIVLAPSGLSMISGLAISITYYAGTFEKIGVEPEFEHVGDFKSGIEPYELTGPSEPAAAAYEALLTSLYDQVVADIADGRGLTEIEVRGFIDDLQLTPDAALERGLVDALAFPDAVGAHIDGLGTEGWADTLSEPYEELDDDAWAERFTGLSEYVKDVRADASDHDTFVAIVHAEGAIMSGDGDGGLFGSEGLFDRPFRRWMRAVRDDEDIAAVVLRVNSPGGSGLASDMMWREIELTKAAGKPVVVSMADYAASGGYFIACNADWIVSQPGTLTGSIGVYGGKFNLVGTYEKIGLSSHKFKRGERSDIFSSTTPFGEEGRAIFLAYLEGFYGEFIGKVADGRGMTTEDVHAVAQGRVWTGEQALEHKLVDELGGMEEALAKAAELASLDEYGIKRLPEQKSFLDTLVEDLASTQGPTVELTIDPTLGVAEDAVQDLLLLEAILADNGVAAYLPGNLTVE